MTTSPLDPKRITALLGLAATGLVVGVTSLPTSTAAFSLMGGSLGTTQRDFRVFNNFTNSAANNNTTANTQFPGQDGAVMAIWKGVVEWMSTPYGGTGAGDPVGGNVLGDSGANFDSHFQGTAASPGSSNSNIVSLSSASCGGGTLAFVEGPISDGWTMRFCPEFTWADGPSTIDGNQFDIQSVACHQYGHALGLGHSGVTGATMFPSIGSGQESARSTAPDDRAGIQAIYGAISAAKPRIAGIFAPSTHPGSQVVIIGTGFSATGNEVWFTNQSASGVAATVAGVSSSNGGTRIAVTIPPDTASGNLLVKRDAVGATSLSDAWPFTVGTNEGPLPLTFDPPLPMDPTSQASISVDITPNAPAAGQNLVDVDVFNGPAGGQAILLASNATIQPIQTAKGELLLDLESLIVFPPIPLDALGATSLSGAYDATLLDPMFAAIQVAFVSPGGEVSLGGNATVGASSAPSGQCFLSGSYCDDQKLVKYTVGCFLTSVCEIQLEFVDAAGNSSFSTKNYQPSGYEIDYTQPFSLGPDEMLIIHCDGARLVLTC